MYGHPTEYMYSTTSRCEKNIYNMAEAVAQYEAGVAGHACRASSQEFDNFMPCTILMFIST